MRISEECFLSTFFVSIHRMRHNQMVLEQESQLNAPDPRETHPPCYEDAILLPRLNTSFASLKRAGLVSNDFDDCIARAAKRSRCRSEEVLSPRHIDNRTHRHILAARIRRIQQNNSNSNSNIDNRNYEFNMPVATASNSNNRSSSMIQQNRPNTNRATEVETISLASNESAFEFVDHFDTPDGHSPYAKRKPKQNIQIPVASTSAALLTQPINRNSMREIVIIENHYRSQNSLSTIDILQPSNDSISKNSKQSLLSTSMLSSSSSSSANSIDNCELNYLKFSNQDIHHADESQI